MNPSIGSGICFVSPVGNKQLIFFHLPVFLSLLTNLAGFIFTLSKVVRSRNIDRQSNRSRSGDEDRDGGNSKKFKLTEIFSKLDEKTKKDMVRYCRVMSWLIQIIILFPRWCTQRSFWLWVFPGSLRVCTIWHILTSKIMSVSPPQKYSTKSQSVYILPAVSLSSSFSFARGRSGPGWRKPSHSPN